jgi:hypothetical protein
VAQGPNKHEALSSNLSTVKKKKERKKRKHFWNIWVVPKSNGKCPFKRHTEEKVQMGRQCIDRDKE